MHYRPILNMYSASKLVKLKWFKFIKDYCFNIILLNVHFKYVCNITAKFQKDLLKILEGVDFTKYALLNMCSGSVF